jgi:hypothetical protein
MKALILIKGKKKPYTQLIDRKCRNLYFWNRSHYFGDLNE